MIQLSTSDFVLIGLLGIGAFYFMFKDSLFSGKGPSPSVVGNGTGSTYGGSSGKVGPAGANGAAVGGTGVGAAGRDLAKAMKLAVSRCNSDGVLLLPLPPLGD